MNYKFNKPMSQRLSKRIDAQNKECFGNTWEALPHVPGAKYIEGWVAGPWIVTLHAWLELADGSIVDTTPTYIENPAKGYFPGRRYTLRELLMKLEAHLDANEPATLPLDPHFRCEMIPPDLVDVWQEANVCLYGHEIRMD